MTTLIITVNLAAAADADDVRAIRHIVNMENQRRVDDDEAPLPTSPSGQLRQAYQGILQTLINAAHLSYIEQSIQAVDRDDNFKQMRAAWADATPAQQAAARAALRD